MPGQKFGGRTDGKLAWLGLDADCVAHDSGKRRQRGLGSRGWWGPDPHQNEASALARVTVVGCHGMPCQWCNMTAENGALWMPDGFKTEFDKTGLASLTAGPTSSMILPGGRKLITLWHAGKHIRRLPEQTQLSRTWQTATEALLIVVNQNRPTMFARITMMREPRASLRRSKNRGASGPGLTGLCGRPEAEIKCRRLGA
jgi:hypothetical protein